MVTRTSVITHRMDTVMIECKIITSGTISSTNERVNVMPHTGELNNYFHRASNRTKGTTIQDYLRDCVKHTMTLNLKPWLVAQIHDVTIYEKYEERGMYGFTVWGDEK